LEVPNNVIATEPAENLGAEPKHNSNSSVNSDAIEDDANLVDGGEEEEDTPGLFIRHPVELLTEDDVSMLETIFKQMNTNDEGLLGPKQMAAALKEVGAEVTEETLRRQLEMGDGDDEGIDFDEFKHMMAIHMKRKLSEDDVKLAFSTFDLNGDGFIDQEELAAAMKHIGFHMEPAEIEDMIRDADKDGDGRISFDEFKEKMFVFGGNVNCPDAEDEEPIDAAARDDVVPAAAAAAAADVAGGDE